MPTGDLEELAIRRDRRVGDNHVGGRKVVGLVPTQMVLDVRQVAQLPHRIAQLLRRRLVRHNDVGPGPGRKSNRIDAAPETAQTHD